MTQSIDSQRLELIKKVLKSRNVKFEQAEIVRVFKLSKSVVSKMFNGASGVSDNFFETFCKHYGVSLSGKSEEERFTGKYVELLEAIVEERKKNASIESKLERIEAQNKEIIDLMKVSLESADAIAGSLAWNQKVLVKILGHILAASEGKELKEAEKKLNKILLEAHN